MLRVVFCEKEERLMLVNSFFLFRNGLCVRDLIYFWRLISFFLMFMVWIRVVVFFVCVKDVL